MDNSEYMCNYLNDYKCPICGGDLYDTTEGKKCCTGCGVEL